MGDRTVVIESVEVIRGDDTRDPAYRPAGPTAHREARRSIERLLTKWLVRAYIKRYNDDMEDEQICREAVEVLR